MVRECTAQEGSHDESYPPDSPKQSKSEWTFIQGDCFHHSVSVFCPGQESPASHGDAHSPMKDIITVHPENIPATPSPATALKFPLSADRTSGRAWERGTGARPDGTYRPPTRTALVGAAAQIKDPSSKRKMAARKPHFAYAGSSESVRSEQRAARRPRRSSVECARYCTHIKALVDSAVRRLERWDHAGNVRCAVERLAAESRVE